jgi:hypothetical protein
MLLLTFADWNSELNPSRYRRDVPTMRTLVVV